MRELSALLYICSNENGSNKRQDGSNTNNNHNNIDIIRNRLRNIAQNSYSSNSGGDGSGNSPNSLSFRTAQDILKDVKQAYVQIRIALLMPFLKEAALNVASTLPSNSSLQSGDEGINSSLVIVNTSTLCPGIRHAYSTLLRVTQLEYQLAETLFNASDESVRFKPNNNNATSTTSTSTSTASEISASAPVVSTSTSQGATTRVSVEHSVEVQLIAEAICNAIGDQLRPLIIRESGMH